MPGAWTEPKSIQWTDSPEGASEPIGIVLPDATTLSFASVSVHASGVDDADGRTAVFGPLVSNPA